MGKNPARLSLLVMILACCLTTTLSFTAVPKVSAATHVDFVAASRALGGVNLRAYCQSLGYADVTLVGSTVADWRCVSWDGSLAGINLNDACTWQYPGPFRGIVVSREGDYYVATSGICYAIGNRNWGGINLQAYCQSRGYASVTTVGSTIYDWRCVSWGASLADINLDDACTWQYPDAPLSLLYRYDNFFVMTSVTCWG